MFLHFWTSGDRAENGGRTRSEVSVTLQDVVSRSALTPRKGYRAMALNARKVLEFIQANRHDFTAQQFNLQTLNAVFMDIKVHYLKSQK